MSGVQYNIYTKPLTEESGLKLVNGVTNLKVQEALDRALTVHYDLNGKQIEQLSEIIKPRLVNIAPNATAHAHPIPAILQQIAYDECNKYSRNFRRSMDIGGSLHRTNPKHHLCVKMDDARTLARYLNAAISTNKHGTHKNVRDLALFGNTIGCGRGAEYCTQLADYAYMINVYDIPIEMIPLIMSQHKTRVLDAWMFLPNALYDDRLDHDQSFYQCYMIRRTKTNKQDIMVFTLGDQSTAYEHDYDAWRKYMFTTSIEAPDHTIFVEHVRTLHTFTHIRFTRVETNCSLNYGRRLNLPGSTECVIVPNMRAYVKRGCINNIFDHRIYADARFVNSAFQYINRQKDHGFSGSNFYTYMDGKSASVQYQTGVQTIFVYKKIEQEGQAYIDLLTSLFILGMIMRERQSREVSKAVKILQNTGEYNFWLKFKNELKRQIQGLGDWIYEFFTNMSHKTHMEIVEAYEPYYMKDATAIPFNSPLVRDKIVLDYHYGNYIYHQPMPVYNFKQVHAVKSTTVEPSNPPPFVKQRASSTYIELLTASLVDADTYKCNMTIAFDPPGDGRCGIHALEFVMGKIPNDGTTWHNDVQLAKIANDAGFNLIAHTGAVIVPYIIGQFNPTIKIFNRNGHWLNVNCDCAVYDYTIADYGTLPLNPGDTYINCANENCTDGAGQAAAFGAMFKGYKTGLKLPLNNTVTTQYNGYTLIIALANNQRGKKESHPSAATTLAYNNILNNINQHATGTVYLPLIGTGIFGCNLCCFKSMCLKITKRCVVVFHSDKQKADFDKTRPCSIGGYTNLGTFHQPNIVRGLYNKSTYDRIAPQQIKNHMMVKAMDLEQYLIDNNITHVIDIASAPGDFQLYMNRINYYAMHYTGPDAFEKKHNYVTFDWNTEAQLVKHIADYIAKLNFNISTSIAILWDCPFNYNVTLHRTLCNLAKVGYSYVTKTLAYDPQTPFDTMGLDIKIHRNDGSNALSSEVYYLIRATMNAKLRHAVDVSEVAEKVDKIVLSKQLTHTCSCDRAMDENTCSPTQFNVGKTQQDVFRSHLRNDVVLKKDPTTATLVANVDITGEYNIMVKCGVAGCRKTRNVLLNTCPKCALIIAPFRKVVDDANETVASSAVTYVKAMRLLTSNTYKYLFIDEFFHVNPCFIALYARLQPKAKIYGLGDPFQIPCCDFELCKPDLRLDLLHYNRKSYRVSTDVAILLSQHIEGFKTMNILRSPIKIIESKDVGAAVVLTYTQAAKEKFVKAGKTAHTIAESEGSTYNAVALYIDDFMEIRHNVGAYTYVGLTRSSGAMSIVTDLNLADAALHTLDNWFDHPPFKPIARRAFEYTASDWERNNPPFRATEIRKAVRALEHVHEHPIESHGLDLVSKDFRDLTCETIPEQNKHISTIVVNGDQQVTDLTGGTAIEQAVDFAQVVATRDVNAAFVATGNSINADEPLRAFSNENVEINAIEEILVKVFKQENSAFGVTTVAYNTNVLRENKSGLNMRIDPRMINTNDIEIQGARMSNFQFVLQQCGKSSMSMISCVLERYMAAVNTQEKSVLDKYLAGLEVFMTDKFKRQSQKTNDELYASVVHYLRNLQEKISLKGKKSAWLNRTLRKLTSNTKTFTVNNEADAAVVLGDDNSVVSSPIPEMKGYVHAITRSATMTTYVVSDNVRGVIDEEVVNINTRDFASITFDGRRITAAPVHRWIGQFVVSINGKTNVPKGEEVRIMIIANVDVHALANQKLLTCTDEYRRTVEMLNAGDLDEVKMQEIQTRINDKLLAGLAEEIGAESKAFNAYRELMREWYEPSQSIISFHLKTQPKEVRKPAYDTADKVGQGVSAWSKMLNCILASIESAFIHEFKSKTKPNVLLAIDRSDAEIAAWFAPYLALYNNPFVTKTDADHTQFDCTQGNGLARLQEAVYNRMGFPRRTTAWLLAMRAKYHASALDASTMAYCTFDFMWQMTSGALYTLTWNTVANMAITGACYHFGDIALAAFKGDDVHIISTRFQEKLINNKPITAVLGHKVKIQHPEVSEFLANIITPTGFFPDVVRRVSRVVSRIYTHPEDWEETKVSIADSLNVLNNNNYYLGACVASRHYGERGYNISVEEIISMLWFLKRCTYDSSKRPRLQNKYLIECLDMNRWSSN